MTEVSIIRKRKLLSSTKKVVRRHHILLEACMTLVNLSRLIQKIKKKLNFKLVKVQGH